MVHDRQPGVAPIPIFTEANLNGRAEGGSGKGIITKSFAEVTSVCPVFCSDLKDSDNFPYDHFDLRDKVMIFDDVPKNYRFQKIFNMPTEGVNINKKQLRRMNLTGILAPKICITSNYPIESDGGNSFERRQFRIELYNYFNSDRKPDEKYGRNLLTNAWDKREWGRFYGFYCYAVSIFFEGGNKMIRYDDSNAVYKQVLASFDNAEGVFDFILDSTKTALLSQLNADIIRQNYDINNWELFISSDFKKELRDGVQELIGDRAKRWKKQDIWTKIENYWARICHLNLKDNIRRNNLRGELLTGDNKSFGITPDDLPPF
jgi:hypothetical protein